MSLHQIPLTAFRSIKVPGSATFKQSIKHFVESKKLKFVRGAGFYELSKPEVIQLNKRLLVQRISDPAVLVTGNSVRTVLGIDAKTVKKDKYMVEESVLQEFRIYVQSKSYNRHLIGGTTFLYLNPSDPDPFNAIVEATTSASLKRANRAASRTVSKRSRQNAPKTGSHAHESTDASVSKATAASPTLGATAASPSFPGRSVEIVISIDTTGCMYPYLYKVQSVIQDLLCELTESIPTLRIGILVHGDYDTDYVTKAANDYKLCNAGQLDELIKFVLDARKTASYYLAQCYELVLHEVRTKFDWTPGALKSLIMIGGFPPHEAHDNPGNLDWRVEAEFLKEQGVRIYAVQGLNLDVCKYFYAELARITMGYHLKLNAFSNTADCLKAICLREGDFAEGTGSNMRLTEFEDTVRSSGRMVNSLRELFDELQGRTPATVQDIPAPSVVNNSGTITARTEPDRDTMRVTRSSSLRSNTVNS